MTWRCLRWHTKLKVVLCTLIVLCTAHDYYLLSDHELCRSVPLIRWASRESVYQRTRQLSWHYRLVQILLPQPDVSVVGRIDGAEAAYVVTPLLFVSSALRMLDMETRGTLKRGVLTSAIVFRDVDLLGELSLDSRLKWSVRWKIAISNECECAGTWSKGMSLLADMNRRSDVIW